MDGRLLWLGAYRGAWADAVRALKYGAARRLGRTLGCRLGAAAARRRWPVGWVVPVPLHRSRRRERGFDQAEELARAAAGHLAVPLRTPLRRVLATRRQARLAAGGRGPNVRGAFTCRPLPPVPVLLVDDVHTTGATTRACARELLRAGAREVRVAVVARAGPDYSRSSVAVATPSNAPTNTCG